MPEEITRTHTQERPASRMAAGAVFLLVFGFAAAFVALPGRR
jgi:hypothetical protein